MVLFTHNFQFLQDCSPQLAFGSRRNDGFGGLGLLSLFLFAHIFWNDFKSTTLVLVGLSTGLSHLFKSFLLSFG